MERAGRGRARKRETQRELAEGRTVPFECSELGPLCLKRQRQTMVETLIFSPTGALNSAWLPASPSVAAKCQKVINRPLERGAGDEDRSWETRRGN